MPWKVEEDKNGYIHVRSDKDGEFETREEAIKKAREIAILNKTILRAHTIGEGYESSDFTSILLPSEWVGKLESEIKIAKAEYMISKNEIKELNLELKNAKIFREEEKIIKIKKQIAESKITVKKRKINLKESKTRLKQAQKSNKN